MTGLRVSLIDATTDRAVNVNSHGELIVGRKEHSLPYAVQHTVASVSNVVPLETNNIFIITYVIVSTDKTNVDTQVSIYETSILAGDASTSEQIILQGGMGRNDRVILPGLDLATLTSRYINVETDTAATVDVVVMGYYELNE